jgi:membrane-bound ClpP family serine protease
MKEFLTDIGVGSLLLTIGVGFEMAGIRILGVLGSLCIVIGFVVTMYGWKRIVP